MKRSILAEEQMRKSLLPVRGGTVNFFSPGFKWAGDGLIQTAGCALTLQYS